MSEFATEPELKAKIVLAGTPGIGKADMIRAVAESLAPAEVGVGRLGAATVHRAGFAWPEPLADGRRLQVGLYGLSGCPDYQAGWDLLLQETDGLLFVASLHREDAQATRTALRSMVQGAGRNRIDLARTPVAILYHATHEEGLVTSREMEEWLGIKPGSIASYVTGRAGGEDCTAATRGVVTQFLRLQEAAAEAA